jgi:hypothetical protein
MTVNTTTVTAAQSARDRRCPLCGRRPGRPCQRKPAGDHLARHLDAYTAGQLSHAYIAMTLGELVVIHDAALIPAGAR